MVKNMVATSASTTTTTTAASPEQQCHDICDTQGLAAAVDADVNAAVAATAGYNGQEMNTTKTATAAPTTTATIATQAPSNVAAAITRTTATSTSTANKNLLLCRRLKDVRRGSDSLLRNFSSLPLFVYATSASTHATSADGVGVAKEAAAAIAAIAAAASNMNDGFELAHGTNHGSSSNNNNHNCINSTGSSNGSSNSNSNSNSNSSQSNNSCSNTSNNRSNNGLRSSTGLGLGLGLGLGAMECLPLSGSSIHQHVMAAATAGQTSTTTIAGGLPTAVVVGAAAGGVTYPHHLNLNPHHHHHHHLLSHHSPYSNNYPLHHSSSHHHIHSEQTKSLQELQHEVGALLEFRDLVIETFPDLKHKMASMTSSTASTAAMSSNSVGGCGSGVAGAGGGGSHSVGNQSVSSANTLTGGVMSSPSLASSRREWEPNIRIKRKLSHKEPSSTTSVASSAAAAAAVTVAASPGAVVAATSAAASGGVGTVAAELSSTSLTRSRSNSHSGKKEPKSGENNNGSVVQDSGFSTETSSSKEGHSASSTNGAMTVAIASNRLSCPESDDELLNLLNVIHRKSNRLREEVEHLQNYEREQLRNIGVKAASSGDNKSTPAAGLTPKTFREHVERLNKEDIKQLRKERDRLLDKLAEMEAETLTGRIKAAKMNDQVEELISVKKDLEEQLKIAMAQKLELSARVQQLQQHQQQQQQQQQQSKSSSSSQSDFSSQRNFLSSATTVLSAGSVASQLEIANSQQQRQRANTFQPVVIEHQQQQQQQQQQHEHEASAVADEHLAFHQSSSSDNRKQQQQQQLPLGRLDGIVSTPGTRNTKCRVTDSKRFSAILLETNVLELQRHLLTLTVQNQVLMQKLESSTKTKTHLVKRLDKSKEDVEDLRFQLEEKNIELEGTKAQLRVLESRIQHSSTPVANSYLHSQNDYETNRSSASTTLMLSRRGAHNSVIESQYGGDTRSNTPISTQAMPPPTSTQISTPSMKAMVHLPMDEIQQHSSSTESAHEHEMTTPESISKSNKRTPISVGRLMSISVGGVSPFEPTPTRGQSSSHTFKKFSAAASKPSKIPLPGSKAAAYFIGKPPTGRSPQSTSATGTATTTSTAGRSPPSANGSSYGSSRSSLSRSTGNLLSGKSPVSLKRADSAQSIRKDTSNNSLSTNTSRSSTSSSIPLATTPYSSSNIGGNSIHHHKTTTTTTTAITPSPRVLQNSPLPKLKRESFTSRVRHLDSLSRAQQQQQQQQQHQHLNNSNNHSTSTTAHTLGDTYNGQANVTPNSPNIGYIVSSTPKPSSIAAQLNSTLRKDFQFNASTMQQQQQQQQQFTRRGGGGIGVGANASAERPQSVVSRRFTSATVGGGRFAREQQQQQQQQQQHTTSAAPATHELNTSSSSSSGGSSSASGNVGGGGGISSSSNGGGMGAGAGGVGNGAHFASDSDSGKHLPRPNFCINNKNNKNNNNNDDTNTNINKNNHWRRLWQTPSQMAALEPHDVEHILAKKDTLWAHDESEETAYDSHYTESILDSYDLLARCGSDNLLVTFDYGYSDSFDGQALHKSFNEYNNTMHMDLVADEYEKDDAAAAAAAAEGVWFRATALNQQLAVGAECTAAAFKVHHVQHSPLSLASSLVEYSLDVDDDDVDDDDDDDINESVQASFELGSENDEEEFYDSIECA